MKLRFFFTALGWFSILILISTTNPFLALAQSTLRWSPPQRIPGYTNDSTPPYLIADSNRTVHAFGSKKVGSDLDIFYSQWSLEKQWTYPVDILLSPNNRQATILGAFLDRKGMMHVAFYGGIASGEIYYSRAPALEADKALAWSSPRNVGNRAVGPVAGALVGDDGDNLVILYNGSNEGNGLYEVHSLDGGNTWSQPVKVFSTDTGVVPIQAIIDSQGRLHAVWTEYNQSGTGEAIYYARLEADHQQWSLPWKLRSRQECKYEADWASIAAYGEELLVVYNCDQPPHEWMNRSTDGGRTWSSPTLVFSGLKGENGPSVLVVDSSDVLHALIPKRTNDERIHALWHSEWRGKEWTIPEIAVPSVPQMGPSYIKGTISQGNVILMVMRNDLGGTESGAWYSYVVLNSPALPTVLLPTPVATQTTTPTPTNTPVLGPTRLPRTVSPVPGDNALQTPSESNPNIGIVIAVIPVILILVVLVAKLPH